MRTSDFHYDLPADLIAQKPCKERSDSRLLHLDRSNSQVSHLKFTDILDLINPDDLLVFNDTKVIPARLFGLKATGGKVEVLIERVIDDYSCLAHVKASKKPKTDAVIKIADTNYELFVEGRENDLFHLSTRNTIKLAELMTEVGHMPLPPYISRNDDEFDHERYQTVYANNPGAVAAPTAGLHFDESLLNQINDKGIQSTFVTLHVGAGTFQPVRVDNIEDHPMHSETIEVSRDTVDACAKTRDKGGRIIAVGTTSVRALETASSRGQLEPFCGETDIFIYPGYTFKSVDAMVTNFHLSESTLLMLVSAFASIDTIQKTYQQAIDQRYRFFSYGDAMFIS